jgi:aminoglycoside phosphotransferase (APT) family kinase protein
MGKMSPDVSTQQVLTAVGRYLANAGADAEDLTLVGAPRISERSKIYRVARYSGLGPGYVVKIPSPGQPHIDTAAPLAAAAQFAALERACCLYADEDTHAVARPVAVLHELGALVTQYVPGVTVSKAMRRAVLEPAKAYKAAAAAGDALRRLHRHAQRPARETSLSELVEEVFAVERSVLRPIGLQLPPEVRRVLDSVPAQTVAARRVLLHGDYVGLNLILTQDDQVTLIDPVLASEGLPEDDVARFLTVLSSAPVFVPGAVLPPIRRLRQRLERTFLAQYGDADQPVILELRLLHEHTLRWRRRREHSRLAGRERLMGARGRVIDLHMRGLLRESSDRLSHALSTGANPVRGCKPS